MIWAAVATFKERNAGLVGMRASEVATRQLVVGEPGTLAPEHQGYLVLPGLRQESAGTDGGLQQRPCYRA